MRRMRRNDEIITTVDLTAALNSQALLRRRRRRRMQPQNEIPVITLSSQLLNHSIESESSKEKDHNDCIEIISSGGEVMDAQNIKKIKVLLIRDGVGERMLTLDVPPECDNLDLITTILSPIKPTQKIARDNMGYVIVGDDSEQRIILTNHNPQCEFQYTLELKAPIMKHQLQLDNFDKFWNNGKFSDVTICLGSGQKIHAHKIILANKSSVFDTIFTNIESKKVEIKDVSYNTMCELLLYIYRGKLSDDKNNENIFDKYSKILTAANKYRVESLKTTCENKLSPILTIENVLDLLLLANSESAINLKKHTIDFIVGHAEEIIELPSYKTFVETHPDVSLDVTRALVVKKRKTD